MTWRTTVDGERETPTKGYLVINGERKALRKLYVVEGGERRLFFQASDSKLWSEQLTATEGRSFADRDTAQRDDEASLTEDWPETEKESREVPAKSWSETLTATETRAASDADTAGRDDTGSLSENWPEPDKESTGPANLTATMDVVDCEIDLSWDPDTTEQQDIYRCTGSGCDPSVDGSKIDDVPAGQGAYSWPVSNLSDGTVLRFEIVTSNGQSNAAEESKSPCTT